MQRLPDVDGAAFEDYLSRIYLAMLRVGEPTVERLAQEGFHPEDIPRAATALEFRELIDPADHPGAWHVRPPELALPRYAASIEARASAARANAPELGALWRQSRAVSGPERFSGVEMLTGVRDIVQAARSLHGLAQHQLRIMLDGSRASRQWVPASGRLGWTVRSGVETSCVVDLELLEVDGVLAQLEQRAAEGARIRVTRYVPFSGVVADQAVALVDLSRHHHKGDGSFVVRRRPSVAAVTGVIDGAFALSTPLAPTLAARGRAPGDRVPLDERDRRILALLGTGASDQLIARQAGVSTRTIERRVRHLMGQLGASTRFQAGVQAARRGWV